MLRLIVQIMFVVRYAPNEVFLVLELGYSRNYIHLILCINLYVFFFRSCEMPSRLNEVQSTVSDSDDEEIDGYKESKTQKYLISMIISYAVCIGPLMILR